MAHQVHHSPAGAGTELFTVDSTATVKVGAEHTDGEYEIFEIDSVRGSFVPPHRHPWPESYYVLHGRMSVQVGSKRYELAPANRSPSRPVPYTPSRRRRRPSSSLR
jgi:quercetin dioxygenase-like cupin family protein